ncbi:MAG: hypothetical protein K0Q50_1983 [Vampirovibrio sp.]|jgi:hypothetical protein|nr:hypothetical protein [Vampirovibrio sp.]
MTDYKVGYYKPTYEFTRITEFMAILTTDGRLVGITGPSTSRQAALDARLFANAADLLAALKKLHMLLNPFISDTATRQTAEPGSQPLFTAEELAEALQHTATLIDRTENGNGNLLRHE